MKPVPIDLGDIPSACDWHLSSEDVWQWYVLTLMFDACSYCRIWWLVHFTAAATCSLYIWVKRTGPTCFRSTVKLMLQTQARLRRIALVMIGRRLILESCLLVAQPPVLLLPSRTALNLMPSRWDEYYCRRMHDAIIFDMHLLSTFAACSVEGLNTSKLWLYFVEKRHIRNTFSKCLSIWYFQFLCQASHMFMFSLISV